MSRVTAIPASEPTYRFAAQNATVRKSSSEKNVVLATSELASCVGLLIVDEDTNASLSHIDELTDLNFIASELNRMKGNPTITIVRNPQASDKLSTTVKETLKSSAKIQPSAIQDDISPNGTFMYADGEKSKPPQAFLMTKMGGATHPDYLNFRKKMLIRQLNIYLSSDKNKRMPIFQGETGKLVEATLNADVQQYLQALAEGTNHTGHVNIPESGSLASIVLAEIIPEYLALIGKAVNETKIIASLNGQSEYQPIVPWLGTATAESKQTHEVILPHQTQAKQQWKSFIEEGENTTADELAFYLSRYWKFLPHEQHKKLILKFESKILSAMKIEAEDVRKWTSGKEPEWYLGHWENFGIKIIDRRALLDTLLYNKSVFIAEKKEKLSVSRAVIAMLVDLREKISGWDQERTLYLLQVHNVASGEFLDAEMLADIERLLWEALHIKGIEKPQQQPSFKIRQAFLANSSFHNALQEKFITVAKAEAMEQSDLNSFLFNFYRVKQCAERIGTDKFRALLQTKRITHSQLAQLSFAQLDKILTPNGIIALEEKRISGDQVIRLSPSKLNVLLEENNLTALRTCNVDVELYIACSFADLPTVLMTAKQQQNRSFATTVSSSRQATLSPKSSSSPASTNISSSQTSSMTPGCCTIL